MADITLVHDVDIERRSAVAPDTIEGDFRDIRIFEGAPDTIQNAIESIAGFTNTGSKGDENEYRALQYFDLDSFIPPGATIVSAVWWIYVHSVSAVAGHTFRIDRITQIGWVEAQATWNDYATSTAWTTPGGDIDTGTTVAIGDITTTGWKSFTITSMVTDAWNSRGKICTFLLRREDDETAPITGLVSFRPKDRYSAEPEKVQHIRITYTLDGKTFQVIVADAIEAAAADRRRLAQVI